MAGPMAPKLAPWQVVPKHPQRVFEIERFRYPGGSSGLQGPENQSVIACRMNDFAREANPQAVLCPVRFRFF